jgi:hypothetical protein
MEFTVSISARFVLASSPQGNILLRQSSSQQHTRHELMYFAYATRERTILFSNHRIPVTYAEMHL